MKPPPQSTDSLGNPRAGHGAADSAHTPSDSLYDLCMRYPDGRIKKLTGYPMTHAECCTMKSKFSEWSQARIIFEEYFDRPMKNDTATINRELLRSVKELLWVLDWHEANGSFKPVAMDNKHRDDARAAIAKAT